MHNLFLTRHGNRILVLIVIILLLALSGGALFGFLRLERLAPPCLFHRITGLNCPGCGGTRAVSAMLRLDFRTAFWYNPLITCLAAILSTWFLWFIKNALFGTYHMPFQSRRYLIFCIGTAFAVLCFFLVRNTGWYHTLFY